MTRNGKIARQSREIRDALNRRLQDGEPGTRLVKWLNGLPGVQAVLAREFGGRVINGQNLSEWKSGGYRDWLARQEALAQARELAADAQELTDATGGRLTDHLATVLAARYAAALASWHGELTDEFRNRLRALRGLCQDIVELRRGDHSGARLQMERQRLEREQAKTDAEVVEQFERWAQNPKVRDWICQTWITPGERQRRLREIFGLAPESDEESGPAQTQSNQIKPENPVTAPPAGPGNPASSSPCGCTAETQDQHFR